MARNYAPKTWNGLASAVARDVYKKIGNKIAKDMTHEYVKVIKAFYNDYRPHVYSRKYRAYYYADANGVRAYTKFVKMDSNEKGFTVGIKVDPMNIRTPYLMIGGKAHMEVNEMVFYNTWVLGQHGGRLPWNAIPEEKRVGNPINGAWKLYRGDWYWEPPVMEKSPMELMDEWFDNYATDENLNKLTQDIVTASINRYDDGVK